MADHSSFREITVNNTFSRSRVIDIHVYSTGSTTARDERIVKTNVAGGYGYIESGKVDSTTRNRFICWRICGSVVELTETSMDMNLAVNNLTLRFSDANVLPDVEVFETHANVVILIATTNSVHRFVFPHPNKLHRHDLFIPSSTEVTLQSIFSEASARDLKEPWNFATFSQSATAMSGWLCPDGHCIFALAIPSGSVLLIKTPPPNGHGSVEQYELRQASVMQKIWHGIIPSSIRSSDAMVLDAAVSLCCHSLVGQLYVFSLCNDHQLRIWACQTQECVETKNLMEHVTPAANQPQQGGAVAQNHMLRKAVHPETKQLYLGVFLSFPKHCQFLVFEVVVAENQATLAHLSTLYSPPHNLVDFVITSQHIWTLWTSSEGETVMQFTTLEGGHPNEEGWRQVFLQPSELAEVTFPQNREPKEVYMEHLFTPGRFSAQTIAKALQIFSKSCGIRNIEVITSDSGLKEHVLSVVDTEIQNSVESYGTFVDDYNELQHHCWAKLYSCVVQYHEVGNKPMGIIVDQHNGMVGLVRKDILSLLRPCDSIEHLYLSTSLCQVSRLDFHPFNIEDADSVQNLANLMKCVNLVSEQLTSDRLEALDDDLKYQCDITLTAEHLAEEILLNYDSPLDFQKNLEISCQQIHKPLEVIGKVLRAMDVLQFAQNMQDIDDEEMEIPHHLSTQNLFHSEVACCVLSGSFQQQVHTRISFCRDLLVLLTMLKKLNRQAGLQPLSSCHISMHFIPKVVDLLRMYYCLWQMTQESVTPPPANALESNLRRLAALEISETSSGTSLKSGLSSNTCVLDLFVSSAGGVLLRRHLALSERLVQGLDHENRNLWTLVVSQASDLLLDMLWPKKGSAVYPELLLTKYQHVQLQEYCRLLHWCDAGQGARHFLLGQAFLALGEFAKALDCFLKGSDGMNKEEFLKKVVQSDETDKTKLLVLYFIRVMRLFEQFGAPEYVIIVAEKALLVAETCDPNLPMLYSNIFKHQLELGHNDEAYVAMVANPDHTRRTDCLHRFIVVLCENGQMQQLVEYPYINLEVVSSIESRARTVDISTHNYYDLLYAFHVHRGNYRQAGSAMYEHGMRLAQELPGLQGLQKQGKCYLAAMNSLRLVESDNAWIVKPIHRTQSEPREAPNMSPKRSHGDTSDEGKPKISQKISVLEIQDIQKEYQLILARLQLIQEADNMNISGPSISAEETVALLVQAGLFDTAFNIALAFNLPMDPIFEGLASKCVKITVQKSSTGGEPWNWLLANDLGTSHHVKEASVADQAWQLLKNYLDKFSGKNGKTYYRCVASRLLALGTPLPTWLINSYKCANPAELLNLYLNYEYLHQAAILSIEYVDAVLGNGKEYFGLKNALHSTTPSVWLPYTALDQLLAALADISQDTVLADLRDELLEKLGDYHETVEQVSEEMMRTARRQMIVLSQ